MFFDSKIKLIYQIRYDFQLLWSNHNNSSVFYNKKLYKELDGRDTKERKREFRPPMGKRKVPSFFMEANN